MAMADKKILCAFLLCAAGAPVLASAADESTDKYPAFQLGLGLGHGELNLSVPDTPGSSDLNALAYTAFVGYRIIPYAAVEAAYLDSGSVSKHNAAGSFTTNPHIGTVTGLGILPIGSSFSLFARAGLAHWWYEAKFDFPGFERLTFSRKANELIWGGGASLSVDRALLRFDFEQTQTSPSFEGQTLDARLRVMTVSVVWTL